MHILQLLVGCNHHLKRHSLPSERRYRTHHKIEQLLDVPSLISRLSYCRSDVGLYDNLYACVLKPHSKFQHFLALPTNLSSDIWTQALHNAISSSGFHAVDRCSSSFWIAFFWRLLVGFLVRSGEGGLIQQTSPHEQEPWSPKIDVSIFRWD